MTLSLTPVADWNNVLNFFAERILVVRGNSVQEKMDVCVTNPIGALAEIFAICIYGSARTCKFSDPPSFFRPTFPKVFSFSPGGKEIAGGIGQFLREPTALVASYSRSFMAAPAYIAGLERVILELHACPSQHIETVHVQEEAGGKVVWEGDVEVFVLSDHPRAKRCFAWVSERDVEGQRVRFFAVLETTVIRTALDAVKFAHVAQNAELINELSRVFEHL